MFEEMFIKPTAVPGTSEGSPKACLCAGLSMQNGAWLVAKIRPLLACFGAFRVCRAEWFLDDETRLSALWSANGSTCDQEFEQSIRQQSRGFKKRQC